ncbi:MAG TPA: maleylpyruvate isomerase N-terminal domain-containing protein [Ornithinibacter sp.]|nr:maleylpyruvate isomerase N-terminal domain-containing protein [Ornithinibacter sp.]
MDAPTVENHLAGIDAAVDRMAVWSRAAGPEAPVPTCPGWSVRDLLAHQGMVHRWATAVVRGEDPRGVDPSALEAAGRAAVDPVGWLLDGAAPLVAALAAAPDDLDVMTFLAQSPPARAFWARRQCHETTVHALDALGAREARTLTGADTWFDDRLASDGIDELLVGFWQRRTKGPRTEDPYTAVVSVSAGPAWSLALGPGAPVTHRLTPRTGAPDHARTLTGSATDLYLALWNRGGTVDDPTGLLDTWREGGAITW